MRLLPVPCHRGLLNAPAITRQPYLTSAQLLSIPPSSRAIHHTTPLCGNEYLAPNYDPSQKRIARPLRSLEAPWPERESPKQANKSSTEPDQVEQRRVVYNKDGHEPSIHRYMSNTSDRIPSPLPRRYSQAGNKGWARKLLPPKEPLATKEAPVRDEATSPEEAAPSEESPSMDPLMLFYKQMVPAKGDGGSAAVGSESRSEAGGIAAEAKSGGAGLLTQKEHQLNEKERRLEDLERKLNALAVKLEEKSEGKGKEQGEAGVGARPSIRKDQPHWAAVKKAIHPSSSQARRISPY